MEYSKLYKEYENNLTLDQKLAINANQMELKENKIKSSGKIYLKCGSNFNQIYQKLDIPEPPKRPLTSFFRFMQENIRSGESSSERPLKQVIEAAAQWKQMSEEQKEKYNDEYKKDMVNEYFPSAIRFCMWIR